MRKLDVSGQTFNRLTAIRPIPNRVANSIVWLWRCKCGNHHEAAVSKVKVGATKSCGCLALELIKKLAKNHHYQTHGLSHTFEYGIWCTMKQRCINPRNQQFKHYGARGIKVCKPWLKSFESFIADVGRRPSRKHSIDRIDNDGNYEPGNVRWATASTSLKNRRPIVLSEKERKRRSEWFLRKVRPSRWHR